LHDSEHDFTNALFESARLTLRVVLHSMQSMHISL